MLISFLNKQIMVNTPYLPMCELNRGDVVESVHYGACAVVDTHGELLAWYGDPKTVTFMRSAAKPFQALPFIEAGGHRQFHLSLAEIAMFCSSHSGTDKHLEAVSSIQEKTGVQESDLLCGIHFPIDEESAEALKLRGVSPSTNHHNCSGKHTGMLAYARMKGWSKEEYLSIDHPVQQSILNTFAEMCDLPLDGIKLGIDGCSAPNFAIPLYNAALALARLVDPIDLDDNRADACQTISSAMVSYPDLVAGPNRFDTRLMQATDGKILAKAGAEGYQGLALTPGAIKPGSPSLGLALKISDGDLKDRIRPSVVLEVLRQLGALSKEELQTLQNFGPERPIYNWRRIEVGNSRPCFELNGVN